MRPPVFHVGDRVQVAYTWFMEYLRGAVDRIVEKPKIVRDQGNDEAFWVEFEEPWPFDDPAHPTDHAEIDGRDQLRA